MPPPQVCVQADGLSENGQMPYTAEWHKNKMNEPGSSGSWSDRVKSVLRKEFSKRTPVDLWNHPKVTEISRIPRTPPHPIEVTSISIVPVPPCIPFYSPWANRTDSNHPSGSPVWEDIRQSHRASTAQSWLLMMTTYHAFASTTLGPLFSKFNKGGEVHHRQTFQFMVGSDFPHPWREAGVRRYHHRTGDLHPGLPAVVGLDDTQSTIRLTMWVYEYPKFEGIWE